VIGPLQLAPSPEIKITVNTLLTFSTFTAHLALEQEKFVVRSKCGGIILNRVEGEFVLPSHRENCTVTRTRIR
jgi:hypothetical protein